jgi:hypothetical protein
MAKRDMDQPAPQQGNRGRDMNEPRDEVSEGGADDLRGIAGDEGGEFDDDEEDAENLDEEDDEM